MSISDARNVGLNKLCSCKQINFLSIYNKCFNYRARSAFKLVEIDDKYRFLSPGQGVVECGCAPGAWTQVLAKRVNAGGHMPGELKELLT